MVVGTGAKGATATDGAEATETSAGESMAATAVNVYEVPICRPLMVHRPLAPVTTQVLPPGLAVIVTRAHAGPVGFDETSIDAE